MTRLRYLFTDGYNASKGQMALRQFKELVDKAFPDYWKTHAVPKNMLEWSNLYKLLKGKGTGNTSFWVFRERRGTAYKHSYYKQIAVKHGLRMLRKGRLRKKKVPGSAGHSQPAPVNPLLGGSYQDYILTHGGAVPVPSPMPTQSLQSLVTYSQQHQPQPSNPWVTYHHFTTGSTTVGGQVVEAPAQQSEPSVPGLVFDEDGVITE